MKLVLATHVYPINPDAPADIPGNFLPPFVAELTKRGATVHVLAPNVSGEKSEQSWSEVQAKLKRSGDPPQFAGEATAPVTRFDWRGGGRNLGRFNPFNPADTLSLLNLYQRGGEELENLVRRQRADAVLACWAVPSGVFARHVRRTLGTPYAVWGLGTDIHTSPRNPIIRPFVVRALREASIRYANSATLQKQVEQLSGMSCEFMPTGRRLPDAAPADLPHDRANFLYAGRFERVKGVDILLDAFSLLRGRGVRAHLYLAGTGSLENALRAQATALHLDDAVSFVGFLSDGPLASYLRAVDAVVIPSRAEALPVIFTEAARFGTPAVTTDVGDLGALARQHRTAIVVAPEDASALAQGLQDIACGDRQRFQGGMHELLERFDIGRAAEKLLSDLARVVSPKAGGAA